MDLAAEWWHGGGTNFTAVIRRSWPSCTSLGAQELELHLSIGLGNALSDHVATSRWLALEKPGALNCTTNASPRYTAPCMRAWFLAFGCSRHALLPVAFVPNPIASALGAYSLWSLTRPIST